MISIEPFITFSIYELKDNKGFEVTVSKENKVEVEHTQFKTLTAAFQCIAFVCDNTAKAISRVEVPLDITKAQEENRQAFIREVHECVPLARKEYEQDGETRIESYSTNKG